MTRAHGYPNNIEYFSEHKDACNYAKSNPGSVVIRYGENWIVGERKDIFKLTKQKSSSKANKINNQYNHINRVVHNQSEDNYEAHYDDYDPFENEYKIYMDEQWDNRDPDDWNRSSEDGWFYED